MKNVTSRVEGTKLILEIDLTKNLGPSSTGKMVNIASTGGFQVVEGTNGLKLNLNLGQPVTGK